MTIKGKCNSYIKRKKVVEYSQVGTIEKSVDKFRITIGKDLREVLCLAKILEKVHRFVWIIRDLVHDLNHAVSSIHIWTYHFGIINEVSCWSTRLHKITMR